MSSDLRALRQSRRLSQAALAELAGVSRQAYSAIELSGARPSVDVALRIAAALGTSVESLFDERPAARSSLLATLVGASPSSLPAPVRVAQVGGRMLAYPTRREGGGVAPADGIAVPADRGRVRVKLLADRPRPARLVVFGCDPAFALVAHALRRERAVEVLWVQAGSRAALEAVARGEAHVAGVHLRDPASGVYNAPWVERTVAGSTALVRFATWEQALVVAPGNPLGLGDAADLARSDVRFVNRDKGTGTRALLDDWLEEAGIPGAAIPGYETTHASGHLEVAAAVAGTADAGVAIRAAGIRFGLEAMVLGAEPYDLVFPDATLALPAARALLDVLRTPALRRQVEALGGYDGSRMGLPA